MIIDTIILNKISASEIKSLYEILIFEEQMYSIPGMYNYFNTYKLFRITCHINWPKENNKYQLIQKKHLIQSSFINHNNAAPTRGKRTGPHSDEKHLQDAETYSLLPEQSKTRQTCLFSLHLCIAL